MKKKTNIRFLIICIAILPVLLALWFIYHFFGENAFKFSQMVLLGIYAVFFMINIMIAYDSVSIKVHLLDTYFRKRLIDKEGRIVFFFRYFIWDEINQKIEQETGYTKLNLEKEENHHDG